MHVSTLSDHGTAPAHAAARRRERSVESFVEEVAPHIGALRALALRLSGDHHDAEDIVQETLLRAFLKFRDFRGDCGTRAWLGIIAKNIWRDRQRREARRPMELLGSPEGLPARECSTSILERPEELFDGLSEFFSDPVARFLGSLPRELRAAVLLVYVEGFSYREAARVLGWSLLEVRSRLCGARQRLRERLGRPGAGGEVGSTVAAAAHSYRPGRSMA